MFAAEQRLFDRQRPPIERFRIGQPALCLPHAGEVVQIDRDLVVVGSVHALERAERAQIHRFRFVVPSESVDYGRKRCEVGGNSRMIGAEARSRSSTERRAAGSPRA